MIGGAAIDWVLVDHAARNAVQAGDMVCADAGGMPVMCVVQVENGRAWLRDDTHPFDWILPVSSFQWKARRTA